MNKIKHFMNEIIKISFFILFFSAPVASALERGEIYTTSPNPSTSYGSHPGSKCDNARSNCFQRPNNTWNYGYCPETFAHSSAGHLEYVSGPYVVDNNYQACDYRIPEVCPEIVGTYSNSGQPHDYSSCPGYAASRCDLVTGYNANGVLKTDYCVMLPATVSQVNGGDIYSVLYSSTAEKCFPGEFETTHITEFVCDSSSSNSSMPSSSSSSAANSSDDNENGGGDTNSSDSNNNNSSAQTSSASSTPTIPDIDNDGIEDGEDDDMDGDGTPNIDDDDIDGDGILNDDDATPEGTGSGTEGEGEGDCEGDDCGDSEGEGGDCDPETEECGSGDGGNCSKEEKIPPTCDGDAIQCSIQESSWLTQCEQLLWQEDLSGDDEYNDGDSLLDDPQANDKNAIPTEEIDVSDSSNLDASGMGGGSCPSPTSLSVLGANIEITWQPICDIAGQIRPFIIALAYIFAAIIYFKSFSGN